MPLPTARPHHLSHAPSRLPVRRRPRSLREPYEFAQFAAKYKRADIAANAGDTNVVDGDHIDERRATGKSVGQFSAAIPRRDDADLQVPGRKGWCDECARLRVRRQQNAASDPGRPGQRPDAMAS